MSCTFRSQLGRNSSLGHQLERFRTFQYVVFENLLSFVQILTGNLSLTAVNSVDCQEGGAGRGIEKASERS